MGLKYHSTRGKNVTATAAEAIVRGIAPDGGLYLPDSVPVLEPGEIERLCGLTYCERAAAIMGMYLEEFSAEELAEYARLAYGEQFDADTAAPVRMLGDDTAVLELWHGPTSAFKDMALQILPYLLTASLKKMGEDREVCILVATSGDTGKAALEGFRDVPQARIAVFYPRDGVSKVQELQMTTQEGANVFVSAVRGNFDDAQTGVKSIFADREFAEELSESGCFLSSANSINWGRLLPQIAYYVSAYCDLVNAGAVINGEAVNFCVPTGNFGNILAAWYAKEMGLPIARLICASNDNRVLTDFMESGVYNRKREFFTTISPSMDILVSSNLERLLYALSEDDTLVARLMSELTESGEYGVGAELLAKLSEGFTAGCCDEAGTREEIARVWRESGYLLDTHTAVASAVRESYRSAEGDDRLTVVVSTASPYKFAGSVLEALGESGIEDGAGQIRRLNELTGVAVPKPLLGVDERAVRFTGWCEPEGMKEIVREFCRR